MLYGLKVLCIAYFLFQFNRNRLNNIKNPKNQDDFTKKSLTMMCIAYIAELLVSTYQIAFLINKATIESFSNWVDDPIGTFAIVEYLLLTINKTLMLMSLLYNLARWYLLINRMKDKEVETRSFYRTLLCFNILIVALGITECTIEFIESEKAIVVWNCILSFITSGVLAVAYSIVFIQVSNYYKDNYR